MSFFVSIRSISIAHAFVLDEQHRCAYPEGRGQYGAVLAIEGEAEYRFVGGESQTVRAGDFFLLAPEAAYSVHIPRLFRHYTVNFDICEGDLPQRLKGSGLYRIPRADAEVEALFARITALWRVGGGESALAAMACLYGILSYAARAMEGEERELSQTTRLEAARERLSSDFCAPISNAALAALCNMSETHFRREWLRTYAVPPQQYRDGLRLSYAKELLLELSLSVAEVAARCGFEDESYFCRFFKKHEGISPGAFRRRSVIL